MNEAARKQEVRWLQWIAGGAQHPGGRCPEPELCEALMRYDMERWRVLAAARNLVTVFSTSGMVEPALSEAIDQLAKSLPK